ncbi:hypothetical protein [Mucilaginibacter sp.]|uniref:hypothetical protein n=1 Tax=Mucilaginibacter sp. TaxID=1882438 RepID=UPI0028437666|nr:hypothetical protein [Mucilaginibacter sp.]MDR3695431.1 hypothetical protein [Mucilaginibacter sp.]
MKGLAKNKTKSKSPYKADDETWQLLKHDINNQLSNILLALEQLRYEIPEVTEDCAFYLDSISISTKKINSLLKETE